MHPDLGVLATSPADCRLLVFGGLRAPCKCRSSSQVRTRSVVVPARGFAAPAASAHVVYQAKRLRELGLGC